MLYIESRARRKIQIFFKDRLLAIQFLKIFDKSYEVVDKPSNFESLIKKLFMCAAVKE